MVTNAERVAKLMIDNNPKSILVHTVPSTRFWLVMYKSNDSFPNWRCVLCDPTQTTWRLVTENVTDAEYDNLWRKLIAVEITNRMKYSIETLHKEVRAFKQNKK